MITDESKTRKYSPTMLLLEEWGTSGKKRATVSDLLTLLVNVELYQAADFVAENLLAEAKPARPISGPSARYPIIDPNELEFQAIESHMERVDYPNTSGLERNDNRSHLHNRKNSQPDFGVDLVKPMEGIGLSTRDDNSSESRYSRATSELIDFNTSTDSSINKVQPSTTKPISSNDQPNNILNGSSDIDNSQSIFIPNLDVLVNESVGSSANISISTINSIENSESNEISQNGIPSLSKLLMSHSEDKLTQ